MKNYLKLIVILPVLVLLASCAAPPKRHALTLQSRASIKSNKLILNTTQDKIAMRQNNLFSSDKPDPYRLMDSGAIVTPNPFFRPDIGLIGGLIITGVEEVGKNRAKKLVTPVHKAMTDFDYMRYFKKHLSNNLKPISWLHINEEKMLFRIQESASEIVNENRENTTLFVGVTYAFNSTMKELEIVSYVDLMKKGTKKTRNKPISLYKNNFYFIYRLDEPNKNAQHNRRQWMKNNAALLKSKLLDSARILPRLIANDIKNPASITYKSDDAVIKFRDINGFQSVGRLIKKKNGYYFITLVSKGRWNGYIYVVNRNAILK